MDGKLLSVKEAAARLRISPSLVYELCAAGELAHVRIGKPGRRGAIRIGGCDLERFLASCRQQTRPEEGEFTYL